MNHGIVEQNLRACSQCFSSGKESAAAESRSSGFKFSRGKHAYLDSNFPEEARVMIREVLCIIMLMFQITCLLEATFPTLGHFTELNILGEACMLPSACMENIGQQPSPGFHSASASPA